MVYIYIFFFSSPESCQYNTSDFSGVKLKMRPSVLLYCRICLKLFFHAICRLTPRWRLHCKHKQICLGVCYNLFTLLRHVTFSANKPSEDGFDRLNFWFWKLLLKWLYNHCKLYITPHSFLILLLFSLTWSLVNYLIPSIKCEISSFLSVYTIPWIVTPPVLFSYNTGPSLTCSAVKIHCTEVWICLRFALVKQNCSLPICILNIIRCVSDRGCKKNPAIAGKCLNC